MEEIAARIEFPVDRVRELQRISQDTISLDSPSAMRRTSASPTLSKTRPPRSLSDAATRILLNEAVNAP